MPSMTTAVSVSAALASTFTDEARERWMGRLMPLVVMELTVSDP